MILAHALHLASVAMVRTLSAPRALTSVRRIGRLFPLDVQSARHVAAALEPWASCLTRAIAVASRLEGAIVVIGGNANGGLHAHAWVEVDGRPLRSWDPYGAVIGRFGDAMVDGRLDVVS